MSFTRREALATLGVASAHALLWACGGAKQPLERPLEAAPEVRTWLREAVAQLRGRYPYAHALAVTRRRTTAAVDVLGAGVARGRWDGVVLTVRDAAGTQREQVTTELSRAGIAAATHALVGRQGAPGSGPSASRSLLAARIDFGTPRTEIVDPAEDPQRIADADLVARVAALSARDKELTSRIVYAASLLDIDDSTVWMIAEGQDFQQRSVRVRRSLTRVAWNGTRPVVSEVARGWTGGVDKSNLRDDQIAAVTRAALQLMTPTGFDDGERMVLLDAEVAASLVDAMAMRVLGAGAAARPEVARRMPIGANLGGALLTLVDDPTVRDAYGTRGFEDTGAVPKPLTLIDAGKLAARLPETRRRGHVGPLAALPSHLRLVPGNLSAEALLDDGYLLEGALGATVDPSSDRVVITVARAIERRGGKATGRAYADLELVGELAPLIASISAVASSTESVPVRDELDGRPAWRSIEAPAIRLKGLLRARRRHA